MLPNKGREFLLRIYQYNKPTPFDVGLGARLPDAYRKFWAEWKATPEPVHYIPEPGKWKRNPETGEVKPVVNCPLPLTVPPQLEKTLLGGDAIVRGFIKKDKNKKRVPKFWIPLIKRSVVYSEILNKYISVCLTQRVIDLVHSHYGFDNYILQTKACDLKTLLALKIKREILLSLRDGKLPYSEEKNRKIYEKYKKYLPENGEEIEWYGLTFDEAVEKLEKHEAVVFKPVPLKHIYRKELVEEIKSTILLQETEKKTSSGWLSKIKNPFSTKSTSV